jgi:hypothetical protein
MHIAAFDGADDSKPRWLTNGTWEVIERIGAVDEEKGVVCVFSSLYFHRETDNCLEGTSQGRTQALSSDTSSLSLSTALEMSRPSQIRSSYHTSPLRSRTREDSTTLVTTDQISLIRRC